ncbi:ChaC family protein [Stanieria sp. NIES-3757]|nr:ChaC family protein [Stanieria sp. NIES-3757]
MGLTRADLKSQLLQKILTTSALDLPILTEDQLKRSIQEILQQKPDVSEVWVFGYGSLIWNPCLQYENRCVGKIYGWHRHFCLWTPIGRGTPENPGLVLGLERGGSCQGVAYSIAAEHLEQELLLLWRREMVADSYIPRWVKVFFGQQVINAIAFTINPNTPIYAKNLSTEIIVECLATAKGQLGSASEYLHQTIEGLRAAEIKDKHLFHLHREVALKQLS